MHISLRKRQTQKKEKNTKEETTEELNKRNNQGTEQ